MDEGGRMNDNVPPPYRGLDRFEARRRVVADLKEAGLLVSIADHLHNVGRCQRCNTVIEPYLSTQWFVRVEPLAEPAIRAVGDGRVRFTPPHWINSYNDWMGKIHDWCISRQLWWGHRIPAWHCERCGQITVARETPPACGACGDAALRQDPDVLDTWFSSSLWPFSTLGWPDRTADLERYYPTTILVTGFDILFFWVARMIMMGLKFMGDVPFRRVYITGMVRDAQGQKMSKTRGNVIDPLDLITRHGADALRFTMAAMATPGSDLPLSEERMAGYRAFANKIWNAARFVLMNSGGPGEDPTRLPARDRLGLPDRWILSRLQRLSASTEEALQACRFDEAANALYRFLWHEYCDWYLELAKPALAEDAPEARAAAARAVLLHVLDAVLRLLHPVMPFLTEELWLRLPHTGETICLAPFPAPSEALLDEGAEEDMTILMEVVGRVRNIRAELNIPPGKRLALLYDAPEGRAMRTIAANASLIAALARLEGVERTPDHEARGPSARAVACGVDLAVPLAGVLDVDAERRRLTREIDKHAGEVRALAGKLDNPDFVSKARPEAVEKVRRKRQDLEEIIDRLTRTVSSLR
jgi:valyl-tRNA synthetase